MLQYLILHLCIIVHKYLDLSQYNPLHKYYNSNLLNTTKYQGKLVTEDIQYINVKYIRYLVTEILYTENYRCISSIRDYSIQV